ncbi:MAG: sigma-70 family RNA polymerase sigma factor [Bacillota bacterium]|uniref:sigma-70 family RNA polymerase sigma factor n=1 Tax=Desulfurispora thermophila TaxID=265470 RepID=UPI00037A0448|nr:FliA/WhiG family RNA polymerase sigma factor [Desulfurispora thermophila]
MNAAELRECWQQYRVTRQPDLRNQLVLHYLWLVRHIAGRLAVRLPPGVSAEDLENCGIIGLIEAVEKFDPGLGKDFAAYAYARVRGAMLDEMRRMSWLPRSAWQKLTRWQEQKQKLMQEEGTSFSEPEIASRLQISAEEYQRLQALQEQSCIVSLDEPVLSSDGSTLHLGEILAAEDGGEPLASLLAEVEVLELAQAVRSLPEKDQLLLSLYYQQKLTLKEVGAVLGISESRVCQLHGRALRRLRQILQERLV